MARRVHLPSAGTVVIGAANGQFHLGRKDVISTDDAQLIRVSRVQATLTVCSAGSVLVISRSTKNPTGLRAAGGAWIWLRHEDQHTICGGVGFEVALCSTEPNFLVTVEPEAVVAPPPQAVASSSSHGKRARAAEAEDEANDDDEQQEQQQQEVQEDDDDDEEEIEDGDDDEDDDEEVEEEEDEAGGFFDDGSEEIAEASQRDVVLDAGEILAEKEAQARQHRLEALPWIVNSSCCAASLQLSCRLPEKPTL